MLKVTAGPTEFSSAFNSSRPLKAPGAEAAGTALATAEAATLTLFPTEARGGPSVAVEIDNTTRG